MPQQFQKVAAHGLIKKEKKFLVTKRSSINDYKPNEWDLAGGTIEFGEDPVESLIREIFEETSLKVKIGKPIFVWSQTQNNRHQFWIIYECDYVGGEVKLNPEEHDDFKWVSFEEIDNLPKIAFLEAFINELEIKN